MDRADIEHLAKLARIALTEEEVTTLAEDIGRILGYVSEIEQITGTGPAQKEVGALYNVMREDEPTHEPGTYTEDLLKLAPERDGRYVKVKKILGQKS
jgi:aspartyl-tRNA(Asn)/glutamyl-tRNA(Gln) amidotransferase subunit C